MRTILVFGLCGLLVAACATPRETRPPPPAAPAEPTREAPRRPVTRTVQGFRIQLLTTPEKPAAEQVAERARAWWQGLPASERPGVAQGGTVPVDVKWKQPYYRVHLGAFASRAEAEEALRVVARSFPEAFIVPETVTVTR